MVIGDMVVAQQRLMKLVAVDGDTAALKYIDPDGVVQIRFVGVSALAPFWSALTPKSLWPETNDFDESEMAKEEEAARAAKMAEAKASRKARRSMKIKRRATK